ncbi:DUF934 domain-containing protein [Shimia sp. FJ5]|uniref:DUF934 domain-containing protein n=1 Tax=Shimia sp. FJ5 TaxID=3079054 RepID=UPI00262A28BA|nr:DUF934 domain-containing protein [Shimia sp. FJ5]MDV4144917.1 DUF934 domain-containing protein [Shimia sp. FJ5]
MTETTQIITREGFVEDRFAGTNIPTLEEYTGGGAVLLPVDANPSALEPHLSTLALVVIPFASSADGRGFSHAAALRTLGFKGHVRARGHVLVDQFRAALRAGFDDVEISAAQAARNPEAQWLAVPHDTCYQTRLFAA